MEKKAIFRTYQVIWYILGLIEILLAFRFIFRLSGASSGSPFVRFIYNFSDPLTAPFRGIYPTTRVEGAFFEWIDLVAALVYLIVTYGLAQFFQLFKKPLSQREVENVVDKGGE